jgi:hypothetical protein
MQRKEEELCCNAPGLVVLELFFLAIAHVIYNPSFSSVIELNHETKSRDCFYVRVLCQLETVRLGRAMTARAAMRCPCQRRMGNNASRYFHLVA